MSRASYSDVRTSSWRLPIRTVAHFDAMLTPEYERLAAPRAVGEWVSMVDGVEQRTPIIGAHFVCLRQMGYEVLHSPALLELFGSSACVRTRVQSAVAHCSK